MREPLASAVTVEPASVEEVRNELTSAALSGKSVLPCGGGCWLHFREPLRPVDIVLGTAKLNRTVFYEPEELVVRVEAGVTLAELQRQLAGHGQEVPWDYPWPDQQTIGGLIAAGIAGPRRLGWGAPRDHVLGVTVVLPEGKIIRPGGRVVKNVAGYDLTRLLVGSRGTLGVIAEATLRVKPLAEDTWAASVAFASASELSAKLRAIFEAELFPSFLEVQGKWGKYRLAAGFEGLREQVAAQRDTLLALLTGSQVEEHAQDAGRSLVVDWTRQLWEAPGPVFRVSVPKRQLQGILDAVEGPVYANAGNGLVRVGPGRDFSAAEARDFLQRLTRVTGGLGGWVVQERGPLAEAESQPGQPQRVRELNESLRKIFDPTGCLAGRLATA